MYACMCIYIYIYKAPLPSSALRFGKFDLSPQQVFDIIISCIIISSSSSINIMTIMTIMIICVYIYIHTYRDVYMYIYIYIERERGVLRLPLRPVRGDRQPQAPGAGPRDGPIPIYIYI